MKPPRAPARASKAKAGSIAKGCVGVKPTGGVKPKVKKGGMQPGTKKYTAADEKNLLTILEEILPIGANE